ncbi:BON domain-containing protein [Uliginosibacterium sp. H1]|uniref:BON domain-containing protein n=1 Tax=Uliginosibacterium sp. H1 TaxID=3114757 RepID=UPI002E17665B|nr:BON domain-containing protein [Uliginosibacterium sp. H1]
MKKLITATMTAAFLTVSMAPAMAADDGKPNRSAGQVVDDATVNTKVKAALADNELTKARNINVDTRNGVVTLNGKVDSRAEVEQATAVARSIEGVSSVNNKLTTK